MEHTRKMVLLPEETMDKLKHKGPADNNKLSNAQTPGDSVSRIDDELLKILNSNKNDYDKWMEYNQALRRFLFFHENVDKRSTNITKAPQQQKEEEEEPESSYPTDMIIKGVPKTFRQKAEGLIEHIITADVDKRLKWDNHGRVTLDGRLIPGTNIVDWVNDAIRQRKNGHVNGRNEFARFLRGINAPRNFVANSSFWANKSDDTASPTDWSTPSGSVGVSTPIPVTRNKNNPRKRLHFQSESASEDNTFTEETGGQWESMSQK